MDEDQIARALRDVFSSPNRMDTNGESANLVDVIGQVADGLKKIADELRHVSEAIVNS